MDDPKEINFTVYLQVYGGTKRPPAYLLTIDRSSVHLLAKQLNLAYVPEIVPRGNVCMAENLEVRPEFRTVFSNVHLRNFLYAILHSSIFETERNSHSQVDFSQFHFNGNPEVFWKLERLGEMLIRMHSRGLSGNFNFETEFPVAGSNVIEPSEYRYECESQKLWINKKQFFYKVPTLAWDYKIAGILPLQQWFEDYSGHHLNDDKITGLRTLIALIAETFMVSGVVNDTLKPAPSSKNS